MNARNQNRTNLENRKTIFFEIGVIIVLIFVLMAFEWKRYESSTIILGSRDVIEIPEDIIIQTVQTAPKPPAPPPLLQISLLQIRPDNVKVGDITVNVETDPSAIIEEYIPNSPEMKEEVIDEIIPVWKSEVQPSFPGGNEAMSEYLRDNLHYPPAASQLGIKGPVWVTFVVEPDGSVSGIKVLRGIGGGCDEEAVRVIREMPKWNPGKQNGKPVRVQFQICISFSLMP